MLSRTAEAFFWIGRYIERAEYTARTSAVHYHLLLEYPDPAYQADTWARLLGMGQDLAFYRERHGAVEARRALEFIALDRENPNSLIHCIAAARENARTIQDQLSSEVWHHLNRFYLEVVDVSQEEFWAKTHTVLLHIRDTGYTLHGVISSTMLHDDRLCFYRLGRDIERALRTARLLTAPALLDTGSEPADVRAFQQCVSVLKSASAYEAYRKTYRSGLEPTRIVEFLLLNERFPRSVRFCARSMFQMLQQLGSAELRTEPERLIGQFAAEVEYASLADIYAEGLESYLLALGDRLATLSDTLGRTYFRYADTPGVLNATLPQRRKPFPRQTAPTRVVQAILSVRHDFTYRYDSPVEGVRTVVRLAPNQRYGRQRLLDVHWNMEPAGEVRQHVDAFGNQVWQIDHAAIAQSLSCSVEMLVENHAVYHAEGALALRGISPDDEDGSADPAEYAAHTPLVDTSDAMVGLAKRLLEAYPQSSQLAEALMHALTQHMRFETGATSVATTASEAFALGRGVCQDYAHIMLALCRTAGLYARYVSGYLPAEGMMHAWVEVLVADPTTGRDLWVAYDPTHARRVDETYVTVALGRDYQDVAPTSGFYTGLAANSLEVRVSTKIETRRPVEKSPGTAPLRASALDALIAPDQAAQSQQ